MFWCGALILFCLLGLTFLVSIFMASLAFDKDIKERLRNDKEVYCIYTVKTVQGNKELFLGTKYRVMSDLPLVSTFKKSFKRIYTFEKEEEVCGVECRITYWVGDEPGKEDFFITDDGRKQLEKFTGYGDVFSAGA